MGLNDCSHFDYSNRGLLLRQVLQKLLRHTSGATFYRMELVYEPNEEEFTIRLPSGSFRVALSCRSTLDLLVEVRVTDCVFCPEHGRALYTSVYEQNPNDPKGHVNAVAESYQRAVEVLTPPRVNPDDMDNEETPDAQTD